MRFCYAAWKMISKLGLHYNILNVLSMVPMEKYLDILCTVPFKCVYLSTKMSALVRFIAEEPLIDTRNV